MEDLNSVIDAELLSNEVLSEIAELLDQVYTQPERELIMERVAKKFGISKTEVIKQKPKVCSRYMPNEIPRTDDTSTTRYSRMTAGQLCKAIQEADVSMLCISN